MLICYLIQKLVHFCNLKYMLVNNDRHTLNFAGYFNASLKLVTYGHVPMHYFDITGQPHLNNAVFGVHRNRPSYNIRLLIIVVVVAYI